VIRSSGESRLSENGAVCDLEREFDRVKVDYVETYGVPFNNVILVDESGRQYGSTEIPDHVPPEIR